MDILSIAAGGPSPHLRRVSRPGRRRPLAPVAALAAVAAVAASIALALACGASSRTYHVSVAFNERYSDAASAEVEAAVHDFDRHAQVLVQPTFPPTVRADVRTSRRDVCDVLRARLASVDGIGRVDCAPA